ncbi:hypothetical protein GYMLUDRAFT_637792 [Collybiopsis luxurians FD-317 M1]|nr:hypothetical protein GYMLUDRAFT_637792 [Collybiopsis luxurians FD-317 M1]
MSRVVRSNTVISTYLLKIPKVLENSLSHRRKRKRTSLHPFSKRTSREASGLQWINNLFPPFHFLCKLNRRFRVFLRRRILALLPTCTRRIPRWGDCLVTRSRFTRIQGPIRYHTPRHLLQVDLAQVDQYSAQRAVQTLAAKVQVLLDLQGHEPRMAYLLQRISTAVISVLVKASIGLRLPHCHSQLKYHSIFFRRWGILTKQTWVDYENL